MAKGRKRKVVIREPNGRAQRYANQERDDNQSVVLEQRTRHYGLSKEQAKDPSWGHTIGVLKNLNIIDERQAKAATIHFEQVIRFSKMRGYPSPNPKVAAYAEMIPGMFWGGEPDQDEMNRLQDAIEGARRRIIDELGHKVAGDCMPAFKAYILGQENGWRCTEKQGGELRTVLNVLCRFYRL